MSQRSYARFVNPLVLCNAMTLRHKAHHGDIYLGKTKKAASFRSVVKLVDIPIYVSAAQTSLLLAVHLVESFVITFPDCQSQDYYYFFARELYIFSLRTNCFQLKAVKTTSYWLEWKRPSIDFKGDSSYLCENVDHWRKLVLY